jgi:hypothetical protein
MNFKFNFFLHNLKFQFCLLFHFISFSIYEFLLISAKINPNEPLYIEVYKFTKDLWSQQIEALIDRIQKARIAEENQENANDEEEEASKLQREMFTKPNLSCRVKIPANLTKIQAANTLNIGQILKATDNSDIIGFGVNHILSKGHLDLKNELSEVVYNVELTESTASLNSYVIFIFLVLGGESIEKF